MVTQKVYCRESSLNTNFPQYSVWILPYFLFPRIFLCFHQLYMANVGVITCNISLRYHSMPFYTGNYHLRGSISKFKLRRCRKNWTLFYLTIRIILYSDRFA